MMTELWWPLARATGIVAWLFLAASVLWGILLASQILQETKHPARLLDLHKWLGGLAVTFTALHLTALVADSHIAFGAVDLVVPFASDWRPEAVAWGVVTLWGLVAVQATSLLRSRFSRRLWRGVHLLSYGLFWAATMHGAAAGTDASARLYQLTAVATILLLVGATAYRALTLRPQRPATTSPPRSAVGVGGEDHARRGVDHHDVAMLVDHLVAGGDDSTVTP
ncbi:MAG: hypothetical protein GY929_17770 [Actinomycetia bacterium]|nr:hypothetical protein [Actinomycetes bacterium]